MDGVGGYSGWRWIFILEGLATVVVGFISFFMIFDYPETASFLTKDEREWVINRLRNQNVDVRGRQIVEEQTFSWKYVRDAFTDWQVYVALVSKFDHRLSFHDNVTDMIPISILGYRLPVIWHLVFPSNNHQEPGLFLVYSATTNGISITPLLHCFRTVWPFRSRR